MNALTSFVEAGLRTLRAAKNAGKSFLSAIKDFTKSIKDFIKKPAVKKPTPKKPAPKKPVSKKEKFSFKDFQRIFLIVKDNPKTLLRKKGYKTYPKQKGIWSNSFSAEQKLQRKEAVTRLMPELGLDFFNSYSWFKSERSIYKKKAEFNKEIFNDPLDADFVINNQEFIKKYGKKKGNQYFLDKNKIPKEGPALTTAEWSVFKKARTEQATYAKMPPSKRISLLNSKKFRDIQDKKIKVLEKIVKTINKDVRDGDGNIITERLEFWGAWIESQSNILTHDFRVLAPIKFFSLSTIPFETQLRNGEKIKNYEAEHLLPVNNAARAILDMVINNSIDKDFVFIKDYYVQGQLLKSDDTIIAKAGYKSKLPRDFFDMDKPNSWIRYLLGNPNINLNSYVTFKNGKVMTIAESVGLPLTKTNQTPNNIFAQNNLLIKVFTGALDDAGNTWTIAKARKVLKSAEPTNNLSSKQVNNNKENLFGLIKENSTTEQSIVDMSNADQTAQKARDINTPTKGISVFDFDDTLAYSKSKVIVNMPDGSIKKITPAEFAVESENLQEQGAEFDFSEFNKVIKGKKGPLADLALKRQEKFGSGDIFVLTARPQASAVSIKAFLDGIGLNIPLENITGLEDGSPDAKALWVLDKTAQGYNDFYFADDALPNVQAVKNILDQVDVKSDVQQAKENKVKNLDKEFNVIIEQQSGKQWYKTYSKARAKTTGRKVGTFEFFIPPSAEDFSGLLYKILPKGEKGNLAKKWFKDNLFDPFNEAEQQIISSKISVANDFQALRKNIDNIPKNLNKPVGVGNFTHSQALRVYIWNMQGMEIPGLSTRDLNRLVDKIENNADLKVFAEKIAFIQKDKQYPKPGDNWVAGNITSLYKI